MRCCIMWYIATVQKLLKTCYLHFAVHWQRAKGKIIQSLLLWKPIGAVHERKMVFLDKKNYDLKGFQN